MGSISVNHKPVVEKDGSRNGRESATPDEEHPLLLSEEFNSPELQELSTILFGMGLEKEEVLLFTMRNISLEKFLRLTDEDLQHVGITDPDKRRSLLYGINTLRSNNVKEQRKEEFIIQEHLSQEDFLVILTNTCTHLNTMGKAMPYIQRKLEEIGLNQFLNNAISARHTLVVVAEKGIEQANQVCWQLQALQDEVKQYRKQRSSKKRVKSGPLIAVLLTATTFCCVMLWKIRSGS
ncbi:uncharacterized protein [Anabrus simplex]|uniref:uncharacterized protein isoform X1 n=1 Tax=Anabrus simplex TaxID=316456 RepID=UPI0035A3C110